MKVSKTLDIRQQGTVIDETHRAGEPSPTAALRKCPSHCSGRGMPGTWPAAGVEMKLRVCETEALRVCRRALGRTEPHGRGDPWRRL